MNVPNASAAAADKRREILAAVVDHLLRDGFRNSGLRALARSAGTSDRMVLYDFASKDALIAEALRLIAEGLADSLAGVLPVGPAAVDRIVAALVASALAAESRPMLRLWFEVVGLAMRGDEPYRTAARQIVAGWEDWIAARLCQRNTHLAPAVLARVEGELMLALLKA